MRHVRRGGQALPRNVGCAARPPQAGTGKRSLLNASALFDHQTFDPADEAAIVVAVSGGSDSLALLLLTRDHLKARGTATTLLAVTIDHGLRPEAEAEARAVASFAVRIGVEHRRMRWDGPKPLTGIPAAARAARYRLLAQAARERGARLVLTGHTADDQAETVAMRAARSGEGRGLAGMAPLTLFDERTWIARPLLATRRQTLQAWLQQQGITWLKDPTNLDSRFERVRVRNELSQTAYQDLLERARLAGHARRKVALSAAELVQRYASRLQPGFFQLHSEFLAEIPRGAPVEALRLLIAIVGGTDFPVSASRAGELMDALGRPHVWTLGGAVIERRSDAVYLARENRSIADVEAGAMYDNRFCTSSSPLQGIVRPWGRKSEPPLLSPGIPHRMQHAAFLTHPAFFGSDGQPPISLRQAGIEITPSLAPFRQFLPDFDLPVAQALAALAGAPSFSPVPRRGFDPADVRR